VLISPAYAQAAGAAPESSLMSFLPLILMFVVLYFLMIRPQMKRAKEHKAMISALVKGDEVVTAGGVIGKITEVDEVYVTIDIGRESPVNIAVQKQAVQTLLPKGTIKGI
jgi:preprotein translocase subunit YajC